jgi:hypothetical protein
MILQDVQNATGGRSGEAGGDSSSAEKGGGVHYSRISLQIVVIYLAWFF